MTSHPTPQNHLTSEQFSSRQPWILLWYLLCLKVYSWLLQSINVKTESTMTCISLWASNHSEMVCLWNKQSSSVWGLERQEHIQNVINQWIFLQVQHHLSESLFSWKPGFKNETKLIFENKITYVNLSLFSKQDIHISDLHHYSNNINWFNSP